MLYAAMCLLKLFLAEGVASYERYRLLKLYAEDQEMVNEIENLLSLPTFSELDVWNGPRPGRMNGTVSVPPTLYPALKKQLVARDIPFTVAVHSLKDLLDAAVLQSGSARRRTLPQGFISFDRYLTYQQIEDYLLTLSKRCSICYLTHIGRSFEGRNIYMIRIGRESKLAQDGIWIDAGIHAREWASISTALYIIHQFYELHESEEWVQTMLSSYDFYIVPLVNPDGYEFTRTTDRMWRKSRSHTGWDDGQSCIGVDLNRNFDYYFGGRGSSNNPCSNFYTGPSAFSEPETRVLASQIEKVRQRLRVYLALHTYGQLWIIPYGHTYRRPADYLDMVRLANATCVAQSSVFNKSYIPVSSYEFYLAAGTAKDWAKGAMGIKYSYTLELRDLGDYHFLMPPSEIEDTGMEMWSSLSALVEYMRDLKDG